MAAMEQTWSVSLSATALASSSELVGRVLWCSLLPSCIKDSLTVYYFSIKGVWIHSNIKPKSVVIWWRATKNSETTLSILMVKGEVTKSGDREEYSKLAVAGNLGRAKTSLFS
jgi:hypothetical protein